MSGLKLDRSFEPDTEYNISPPMRCAVTIPVLGVENVVIYVAASSFSRFTGTGEIDRVAKALRLEECS